MKKAKIVFSIVLAAMISAVSISTSYGLTLYEDGDYTFADAGSDSVALYAWSGSGELVVPNAYQNNKYVTSVYNYAFMDNTDITSLNFSNNYILNTIGTKSFFRCTSITGDVVLPNTISKLSLGAFEECTNMNSITFNGAVEVVPEQFCYNDYLLKNVNLPENLRSIEALAFANCYSLRNVFIPASVNYIADTAFTNCGNLIIECYYGSYAHNYAVTNGINYTILDGIKLGDADGDGYININDVTAVQRHLALFEALEGIYLHAADANQNGEVKIDDATVMQEFLAEYQVQYPVGEVMTQ